MRKAFGILAIIFFALGFAYAGENSNWWSTLKAKVKKITPTKTTTTATAVGGLRGTKEEGEGIYWKGKEPQVSKEELESFNSALDLAISGQAERARSGFEAFLRTYPSSALSEDARQSLKLLSK